jgi:hypothetical protein
VFAPGNSRQLASLIAELLGDDAQRTRLAVEASRRQREHFSIDRSAGRLLELVRTGSLHEGSEGPNPGTRSPP